REGISERSDALRGSMDAAEYKHVVPGPDLLQVRLRRVRRAARQARCREEAKRQRSATFSVIIFSTPRLSCRRSHFSGQSISICRRSLKVSGSAARNPAHSLPFATRSCPNSFQETCVLRTLIVVEATA